MLKLRRHSGYDLGSIFIHSSIVIRIFGPKRSVLYFSFIDIFYIAMKMSFILNPTRSNDVKKRCLIILRVISW